MTLNYLAYTRTVLLSDARVSDARRESLAKRIVRDAKEHGIKTFLHYTKTLISILMVESFVLVLSRLAILLLSSTP